MKLEHLLAVCDYDLFEIKILDYCALYPEKRVLGSSLFHKKEIPLSLFNLKVHSFTVDSFGILCIKILN